MSRRDRPGDDAPHQDDDDFDHEDPEAADRPVRWWNKDVGTPPVVAVGLAISTVVVVMVVVFGVAPRQAAPPEQNLVFQPPPQMPPPPPGDPGSECTISNLRKSQGLFSGFGGQPALMLDYVFPGGQDRLGPRLLVAVVTAPGGPPATANLSPFMDDRGTVTLAPLDLGGFPGGTTVYFGDRIGAGPDGLPKRVSNILTLE
jgi:hypothetical protein